MAELTVEYLGRVMPGRWRLEKRVDDRVLGADMGFVGEAEFSEVPDGLVYRESGEWQDAPWGPLAGERVYRWRMDRGFVDVRYADGSAFHAFEPGLAAGAEHLCGQDRYRGLYRFDLPEAWSLTWHVKGPYKDYSAASLFSRPV